MKENSLKMAGMSSSDPGGHRSNSWQGGVITLMSKNSCGSVLSWLRDPNGRVISLLISYGDVRMNAVNIYAPQI